MKLAPGLVPAAALAGRLLAEAGEMRKASRILEAAWRANPHPDLAETYAHVRPGDSARDRLARVQTLAKLKPATTPRARWRSRAPRSTRASSRSRAPRSRRSRSRRPAASPC